MSCLWISCWPWLHRGYFAAHFIILTRPFRQPDVLQIRLVKIEQCIERHLVLYESDVVF
jgi:hypothetical protein